MRMPATLCLMLMAPSAMAEVPRVVTDIPPVHALVSLVMGNLGAPDLLLDRGGNAHDFTLRPSQAAGLQAADLVVWIGPEMTPWLPRLLDGPGAGASRLGLLALDGTTLRDFAGGEEHDHEHDHDDHHGHSHDGADPHAWLDPANALVWLSQIAAELSRLDPANSAAYAANADRAGAGIAALDQRLAAALTPVQGRAFVTGHDAYGYFTARYNLTDAGSVSRGDASAPGAARLRALQSGLQAAGVVCAFPEVGQDPKLLATVLEGSGVRLGGALDPEGRSVPAGPDAYGAILEGLARELGDCLGQ